MLNLGFDWTNLKMSDFIRVEHMDGQLDYLLDITSVFRNVFGKDVVRQALLVVAEGAEDASQRELEDAIQDAVHHVFCEVETKNRLVLDGRGVYITFRSGQKIKWFSCGWAYIQEDPSSYPFYR